MDIRDALESDAEAIAAIAGRPEDVVLNMVHDRSVRVAVPEAEGSGNDGGRRSEVDEAVESGSDEAVESGSDEAVESGSDEGNVTGFVAFDVRGETVHVTDFGGAREVTERLLEEPRRFATHESMPLEIVVSEADDIGTDVIESIGFENVGPGPRFDGRPTTRYRLDPSE